MRKQLYRNLILGCALVWALPGHAEPLPEDDLTRLSLEDLMQVEVTTASKRAQRLADVPAAVYVLTGEEIRRSGAASIPEALRLVPGVNVARIDNHKWAVSIRGFQGLMANKLLVLIDGRSVYSPIFSGTTWALQDTLLEDIDRIEVIRGPGASVWGANAVNGVINIITKSADETKGVLALARGGTAERTLATRVGGAMPGGGAYRVYAKARDYDRQGSTGEAPAEDGLEDVRAGFRLDRDVGEADRLTLQGDVFDQDTRETENIFSLAPPFAEPRRTYGSADGANILGRWTRSLAERGELEVQFYYDRNTWRDGVYEGIRASVDTLDLDLSHRTALGERHDLIWGVGYRFNHIDEARTSTALIAEKRNDSLFSAFVQDDIKLFDDRLVLTLGSKFEHNDATGFEIQPTARLLAHLSENQSAWLAVSRAVRTPAAFEEEYDGRFAVLPPQADIPLPIEANVRGDKDFEAEKLWAFEAGYRLQASDRVSFDVAAFLNHYRDLATGEIVGLSFAGGLPPTRVVADTRYVNDLEATSYGVELAVDWQPASWWRLRGAYGVIDVDFGTRESVVDTDLQWFDYSPPQHQAALRSSMSLGENVDLDATLRLVDEIESLDIDGYAELDLRLAWRPKDGVELAIVGQNLLQQDHLEFRPEAPSAVPTEVERAVYGQITLRF